MGQAAVHSSQTAGRPVGSARRGKRTQDVWGDQALITLVHSPDASTSGVPKLVADKLFRKLAGEVGLATGKIRMQLIPDSTWKRASKTLGASASQTVSRLANALFVSERIWQNEAKAIRFLLSPHVELGNVSPYSLLQTESGARRVENVLAALEYGFPV